MSDGLLADLGLMAGTVNLLMASAENLQTWRLRAWTVNWLKAWT